MRVVAPSKRRGWVDETFVVILDDDVVHPRDYLRGISKWAIACDVRPFSLVDPLDAAILYARSVASLDSASDRDVGPVASNDIEREAVHVAATPLTHREFVDLVHRGGVVLGREEEAARRIAREIDEDTVKRLWLTVRALKHQLAAAAPPYPPGTDSFDYWALAVIFGPPSRLRATLSGSAQVVGERELGLAERLARLPEDVYAALTGKSVDFVADGPRVVELAHQSNQVAPQLIGVYFVAHGGSQRDETATEAVGVFRSVDRESLEIDALKFASNAAKQLGHAVVDVARWTEQRNEQFYSGLPIVSVPHRWAGTAQEFLEMRHQGAVEL